MSETRPSPEFENMLREAVATPNPDPEFVNKLGTRLLTEATKLDHRSRPKSLRLAWAAIALLIIAAVGYLAVSPSGAAAMKRLLGYIPGLGIIEQGAPVRMLDEPVSVRRDRVQLTVEKGVVDDEKTVLLIRVEGLHRGDFPSQSEMPVCDQVPELVVAGNTLQVGAAEGFGWETGYAHRMVFPAIPASENQTVLRIPCLLQSVSEEWPQDWEIPLRFVPATDMDIAPVIELPTQPAPEQVQASHTPEDNQPALATTAVTPDFGISITIDRYVELDTGYILFGSLRWTNPDVGASIMGGQVTIQDAAGNTVPYLDHAPEEWPAPDEKRIAWAYQIEGKDHEWPLTLEIDTVMVDINLLDPVTFQFDPGPNPAIDRAWELNLKVPVGGYQLQILTANAIQDNFRGPAIGYEFVMESGSGVIGAMVLDLQNMAVRGGGGGGGGGGLPGEGPFKAAVMYEAGKLPPGPLTLTIAKLTVVSTGPWQVTWSPGSQ